MVSSDSAQGMIDLGMIGMVAPLLSFNWYVWSRGRRETTHSFS
jgi:hypothetical protein